MFQLPIQDSHHLPSSTDSYTCPLTVMFCDLVGSTALSEQLAPCTYWKVLRAYQQLSTRIIQQGKGYIAQHLGDGLLVYFGYPNASEQDALLAVQAGLEIVVAMEQLHLLLQNELELQLAVRVGIATGKVVMGQVGTGSRAEWLAIGIIPNIAARLQSLASSNSVVFCRSTYQLVAERCHSQFLGQRNLKGISQPISVYQLNR